MRTMERDNVERGPRGRRHGCCGGSGCCGGHGGGRRRDREDETRRRQRTLEERRPRPRRRAGGGHRQAPRPEGRPVLSSFSLPVGSAFDELAARYDAWYDTASGRVLYDLELGCLRPFLSGTAAARLEVGVGSGRFAAALGVGVGFDPARAPLRLAAKRGVPRRPGCRGTAALCRPRFRRGGPHRQPLFRGGSADSSTRPAGCSHPAESSSSPSCPETAPGVAGTRRRGVPGHPFYQSAHFLTLADHLQLLGHAGFESVTGRSTLIQVPTDAPVDEAVQEGIVPGTGFVALVASAR